MPIHIDPFSFTPTCLLIFGLILLLMGHFSPRWTGRLFVIPAILLPLGISGAALGLRFLSQGGIPAGPRLLIPNDLSRVSEELCDDLSLSWLCLSSLAAMMLFLWRNWTELPIPGSIPLRESFAGLLLLAMTQCVALTGDVWLQWGAVALSGWLFALLLGRDPAGRNRGKVAAACLVWLSVADLLWLLGLTRLLSVFGSPSISLLEDPQMLQQLSAGQTAVIVTGLMSMLISLVLRCGLYPLMSWSGRSALSLRDVGWVSVFQRGLGILLLLRWLPLLAYFPQIRLLLAGLGGLSALLLAVIGWGCDSPGRRMVHLLGAEFGLVWIGAAVAPENRSLLLQLGLGLILLIPILLIAVEQNFRHGGSRKLWSGLVMGAACLLCGGFLGKEQVLDTARLTDLLPPVNSRTLVIGAVLGQVVVAFCLFQLAFGSRQTVTHEDGAGTEKSITGKGAALILGLTLLGFAAMAGVRVAMGEQIVLPTIPMICIVIMLIGAFAARTWPWHTPAAGEAKSLLRRLAEEEFYVPWMIEIGLLMPLRGIAQLARLLDRMVISKLLRNIPLQKLNAVGDVASLAEEETTDRIAAIQTLLAAIVMIVGVSLAGMM